MSTHVDSLYRKMRQSKVTAPDWVIPYIVVRPSESRRLIQAAFRDGSLGAIETRAVRRFIQELEYAERSEKPYPTWNEFVDAESKRTEYDDEAFAEEAALLREVSDWRDAFSRTLRKNPTDMERFNRFMDEMNARYEEGE